MKALNPRLLGMLIVLHLMIVTVSPGSASSSGTITVGSKNFMESKLLAEMFAQLIEARTDLAVERRLGLAGTQVCFEALKSGAIDVYPEYTGTGLVSILQDAPGKNARETLQKVRAEFLARWNLWWLSPLGFENAYALAVTRTVADQWGLRTISDLANVSKFLKAGLGYEFIKRPDGLPGLHGEYGLSFQTVQGFQQALKYQAAKTNDIDVLDVYTTDGRLTLYDFEVLEDDHHFFPPYEAAALVNGRTLAQNPELGAVLGLLANALDARMMRRLNFRLQEGGESVIQVAHDALASLALVQPAAKDRDTSSTQDAFVSYMWAVRWSLFDRTLEHIGLAGVALGLGILISIPLALILERHRHLAEPMIRLIGITQTIPSIALLAFMIPFFGVGLMPAVVALWIYSIFPIIRNSFSGLRDAAPHAVEAGRALGMTEWQILRWVRLPLAAPFIMAGIRTSAVITVGTATLAAFIGAGGLGVPIVSGLQMANATVILSGAVPAAVLALFVDGGLSRIERWVQPPGLDFPT